MTPAIFLDRDGTINDDVGYMTDVARLYIYPYAPDAIRLLRRAGYAIIVVTNQGGVARGLMTTAFVEETHRRMAISLTRAGAHVDGWYYCPHHPEAVVAALGEPCECRKPGVAMPRRASAEHDIDLGRSWVIGDHWRDVQMGHAVGARSVLLRTGHGRDQELRRPDGQAVDAICDNLMAAAAFILRR